MSHETCKKAKSGLIDLSSTSSVTISSYSSAQTTTISTNRSSSGSSSSEGSDSQGGAPSSSDSQRKNLLVSNHRITLGCSKSLKVVTTTNSSNNSGSQFKYRLGKKSAPIAPAPLPQEVPSSLSSSSAASAIKNIHKTVEFNSATAVTSHQEIEHSSTVIAPTSSMTEKKSVESNSFRGMSKNKSSPSRSSSSKYLLTSNVSSPATTNSAIAPSHSSHQRYTSHDLHKNQSSYLIRSTSSSSTTGVSIASTRSINTVASTGSNNSNSSNSTRRIIFQTLYESQRRDTDTKSNTQISKNQEQRQQTQTVDMPQSQLRNPPNASEPAQSMMPPLPSIISQPSSPEPSVSGTAMLTRRRSFSEWKNNHIETTLGAPSSNDYSLSASSTLSQDGKRNVNTCHDDDDGGGDGDDDGGDDNNSNQHKQQEQRHEDNQDHGQNLEQVEEGEIETHTTFREDHDDQNQKLIPLSSLDLRQLEIPPYSPHPHVVSLSCPSSPSLLSNSVEQSENDHGHDHNISPTSIISEKNNKGKTRSVSSIPSTAPYPNSILRKKNFLDILREHIQAFPLMSSSKESMDDKQKHNYISSNRSLSDDENQHQDQISANSKSESGNIITNGSSHNNRDKKSNNQGPPKMRSIASERIFRNQSLPLSQEYDKLNKTIHSISVSGIDLSIPPRDSKFQKQSKTSNIKTFEKKSNEASHHRHSATCPQLPTADETSLRKSLSDSCLYSFQDVSTLGNDNDTITKAPVANMISAPSAPLSPRKLQTQRRSSITSINSYSSDNSFNSKSSTSLKGSSMRKNVRFSNQLTRHISHEEMGRNKIIRFDPRVWVHEIQCPPVDKIWYSAADMNRFKYEAILRIRKWSCKHQQIHSAHSRTMISTGTGRIVNVENGVTSTSSSSSSTPSHSSVLPSNGIRPKNSNRVIYTNPALSCESEDDDEDEGDNVLANLLSMRDTAVLYEFKSILIVDSHDIFLKLLSKGLKLLFPHTEIATACTVEQAWKQIERMNFLRKKSGGEIYSHGFDLIVVEERLKPHIQPRANTGQQTWNGSSLIQKIKKEIYDMSTFNKYSKRYPLIVGISAYLNHDMQHLKASGSDFVWGKPPPKMDDNLKMEMLKKVMIKRNRPNVEEMFQEMSK
eukprot:CAMPEP_0203684350 /NCGR_PEP_ID=MMETSP0090-20130426/47993_1 /ASSEMBLY_ACC=CAM_ASM_001088 /TAXON_ID=426623 /ORGANISM="Chaetoceros affinis, Strain CCMP159" /LENGTH=1130 /DNA_ID=CAMNT_0050553523 /DNA_START=143 /DNA_END=3535 /DNA_ORIENTATION=+